MSTEEEIKEYFDSDEWNNMSNWEKDMFTNFSVTLQIFTPMEQSTSEQIKVEPASYSDENISDRNLIGSVNENEIMETDCPMEEQETVAGNMKRDPLIGGPYLYCENCKRTYYCEGFCSTCPMLSHILDNDVRIDVLDRVNRTLPKNILEIKRLPHNEPGVFVLQTIPEGTKFGPYEGLQYFQDTTACSWNLENGKFIPLDKERNTWMQCVHFVTNLEEHNLVILQSENSLYFRSSRQIIKGEQLFVYYDKECVKKSTDETLMYYRPVVKTQAKNVYACTYCCLGFSAEVYLSKHKTKCPYQTSDAVVLGKIVQCPFCMIWLDEQEYFGFHMTCCCEKHLRKCLPNSNKIEEGISAVTAAYSCSKCKYTTTNSCDYTIHTCPSRTRHFNCTFCSERFSTKELLASHISTHLYVKDVKCQYCPSTFSRNTQLERHTRDKHGPRETYSNETSSGCVYSRKTAELMSEGGENSEDIAKDFALNAESTFESDKIPIPQPLIEHNYFKPEDCFTNYYSKLSHSKRLKIEYGCTKCNYTTNDMVTMKRHHFTHVKNRVYQCKVCGLCLSSQHDLARHYRVHGREQTTHGRERSGELNSAVEYNNKQVPENMLMMQLSSIAKSSDIVGKQKDTTLFWCRICDVGYLEETSFLEHQVIHM